MLLATATELCSRECYVCNVNFLMQLNAAVTDLGWQYRQTGKTTADKQVMTLAQAAFGVSTPGSIGPAPTTGGKPPTAPRASAPGARRLSFDHMAGLHLFLLRSPLQPSILHTTDLLDGRKWHSSKLLGQKASCVLGLSDYRWDAESRHVHDVHLAERINMHLAT